MFCHWTWKACFPGCYLQQSCIPCPLLCILKGVWTLPWRPSSSLISSFWRTLYSEVVLEIAQALACLCLHGFSLRAGWAWCVHVFLSVLQSLMLSEDEDTAIGLRTDNSGDETFVHSTAELLWPTDPHLCSTWSSYKSSCVDQKVWDRDFCWLRLHRLH